MRWSISAGIVALALVAAACAQPGAAPASAPAGSAPAASQAPPQAVSQAAPPAAAAPAASWQRPADVTPLPAEGKFEVISETPWPGQKVRVFFFGVQG